MKKGDTITIYEPYYYDTFFGVQRYLLIEGEYEPLEEDEPYILFLQKVKDLEQENVYSIVGIEYGKYYVDKDIACLNDKYKKFYKEVMEKYES